MKKQPISFEAQKQGQNIKVTAIYPDNEAKSVLVYGDDLKTIYGINAAKFMEQHGENEEELQYLFDLVNSVQMQP